MFARKEITFASCAVPPVPTNEKSNIGLLSPDLCPTLGTHERRKAHFANVPRHTYVMSSASDNGEVNNRSARKRRASQPLVAQAPQRRRIDTAQALFAWSPDQHQRQLENRERAKSGGGLYIRYIRDPDHPDEHMLNAANTGAYFARDVQPKRMFGEGGLYRGIQVEDEAGGSGKRWYMPVADAREWVGRLRLDPSDAENAQRRRAFLERWGPGPEAVPGAAAAENGKVQENDEATQCASLTGHGARCLPPFKYGDTKCTSYCLQTWLRPMKVPSRMTLRTLGGGKVFEKVGTFPIRSGRLFMLDENMKSLWHSSEFTPRGGWAAAVDELVQAQPTAPWLLIKLQSDGDMAPERGLMWRKAQMDDGLNADLRKKRWSQASPDSVVLLLRLDPFSAGAERDMSFKEAADFAGFLPPPRVGVP